MSAPTDQEYIKIAKSKKLSLADRIRASDRVRGLAVMSHLVRGNTLMSENQVLVGDEYPSWRNSL
jgi:hypothetical protein